MILCARAGQGGGLCVDQLTSKMFEGVYVNSSSINQTQSLGRLSSLYDTRVDMLCSVLRSGLVRRLLKVGGLASKPIVFPH